MSGKNRLANGIYHIQFHTHLIKGHTIYKNLYHCIVSTLLMCVQKKRSRSVLISQANETSEFVGEWQIGVTLYGKWWTGEGRRWVR